jgi:hypothetical protein
VKHKPEKVSNIQEFTNLHFKGKNVAYLNDKKFFYKYVSLSSTLAILSTKKVRWSSPVLFNDPFDMPTKIDFQFSGNALADALLDEIVHMVFSEEETKGRVDHPLFAMTMISRKNRHKSTEEEFKKTMLPSIKITAERYETQLSQLRQIWELLRLSMRVFCVSEVNDDILMWAHYADNHEGCVLKLKCIPELDRPLCAAIPIQYQDEYPLRACQSKYIKHLTGQEELNDDDLFIRFISTKSNHWAYEKEWRIVGQNKSETKDLFQYESILPNEVEAIYLGCRMKPDNEKEVINLVKKDYSSTALFKARVSEQRYSIEFDRIL